MNSCVSTTSCVSQENFVLKQCLAMFAEINESTVGCKMFHDWFGDFVFLGIHVDLENRAKMSEFLWFSTSKSRGGKLSFARVHLAPASFGR